MGTVTRAGVTLSLSCLLVAACGGGEMQQEAMIETAGSATNNKPTTRTMTMSAAGGKAPSAGVVRATARISPLMLAPTAPAAGTAGTTATTAASAGAAAAAGAGAAGTTATSSTIAGAGGKSASGGAGGSAGSRSFADEGDGAGYEYAAAGSGGTAAAGGAGGSGASSTGTAGTTAAAAAGAAAPATGAAGMAATTTSPATAGAAGMQAPAMISGSATFASSSSGVNLTVMVSGCVDGKEYPMHIHTGGSCESAMTQMGHWDMTRGEGIPNITCGGKQGVSMTMRTSADPTTAWTVGDGAATDVVGHVVVIHDADDPTQRIACGPITKN